MRKILAFIAISIFALSVLPILSVNAVTVPNVLEGNWTSYKEIFVIDSGQLWSTGFVNAVISSSGISLIFPQGNGNTVSISSSGTQAKLQAAQIAAGNIYFQEQSAAGSYLVAASVTNTVYVYLNGALETTITADSKLGNLYSADISPDGQWIILVDVSSPVKIEVLQGQGTGPTLPLTANPCIIGGASCNVVGSGQSNYVFGSGTTTTNINANALAGNYTGAQQQIQANPLPYGLIALIIILTIGAAIYLRFTDKSKGGFRQPKTTGRGYRGP